MVRTGLSILLAAALVSNVLAAMSTISTLGSKFFTSDGQQFFIKGVAYQLVVGDPLVNTNQCQLDASLMQTLGANTIRVYHVDPTQDHSGCMNAFASKGIYVFLDLDGMDTGTPPAIDLQTYIGANGQQSWTQNKSAAYRSVMDNFQQYDNLAGFFVGNEVLNTLADSPSAPYLLAAAADMKSYAAAKKYRKIPIGYSATDTAILRPMLQDYLVCRQNASERLDFYSLNAYEWCGTSATYSTSGYDQLQANAEGYPVPIFLSETGCNTVPPRTFEDQSAIFGSNMVGTWSGAIIYEWVQEVNSYGLVNYGPFASGQNEGTSVIDGWTRQGTPTPVSPDFSNLQGQWATLTPSGVASSAYAASAASITPPPCPSSTSGGWVVDPSAPLPMLGASGVSSGMPSGVPYGSITVMPSGAPKGSTTVMVANSTQVTNTVSGSKTPVGSSASAATSSATSSAGAKSAAGKTTVNPLTSGETGLMGMMVALMTVGAAAVLWL